MGDLGGGLTKQEFVEGNMEGDAGVRVSGVKKFKHAPLFIRNQKP